MRGVLPLGLGDGFAGLCFMVIYGAIVTSFIYISV